MSKIIVINTGGTIAMSQQGDGVNLSEANPLVDVDVNLQGIEIDMIEAFNIPSPHMTYEKLLQLRHLILTYKDSYDGIVVTHGTDTMEESAYFLELTTDLKKPLVLTGAMRDGSALGADGPANLLSAIQVAAEPQSLGRGVQVVFNDQIFNAIEVNKIHTTNPNAFANRNSYADGEVSNHKVYYLQNPKREITLEPGDLNAKVALIKISLDMDIDYLTYLPELNYQGIIIEAFGSGNLTPQLFELIKELTNRGLIVIITSRVEAGRVEPIYTYDGGGGRLEVNGIILAGYLSGLKARLKLKVALSRGLSLKQIRSIF